jgi:hypothetical protein
MPNNNHAGIKLIYKITNDIYKSVLEIIIKQKVKMENGKFKELLVKKLFKDVIHKMFLLVAEEVLHVDVVVLHVVLAGLHVAEEVLHVAKKKDPLLHHLKCLINNY